jgi:hypothetical protein
MVLPEHKKDGVIYSIEKSNQAYYRIFEYDIRFYDKNRNQFFCINTYPVKPNDFLKQVSFFEGCY